MIFEVPMHSPSPGVAYHPQKVSYNMSVITPFILESPEVRGMASNERKVIGW